ncbi:anion permease [Halolactibacillus miurensis]|uniref:Probable membrane transporter protein n=2 Tax=Halolactibacillus TaxID=306539 RepID=A0A1I6P602_9BACI|nr:sulfite exporter TauE/SafE family protein [Halolactibacillus miurensis]GEM03103.1 anion permease [Halolactibacillus miurensis]SFS35508.1 hypothetical protein SAMN05421668_101217 [Halolactibacillus miurensis]
MFDYSLIEWGILLLAGIVIGFSKTGIQGSTIFVVVLMALTFGGIVSSGMMLLLLMVGDVFAVKHYGHEISIKDILHLLPPAVIGVLLGVWYGQYVNDQQFKMTMGVIVLLCIVLLVYKEIKKAPIKISNHKWLTTLVGVVSGFSSMVGNAAGPIFAIYILSKQIGKRKMISSTAWFFLLLNMFKLPFHVFVWQSIEWKHLLLALILLPVIFAGTRVGIWLVSIIKEETYRVFIFVTTVISAIYLFV